MQTEFFFGASNLVYGHKNFYRSNYRKVERFFDSHKLPIE